MDYFGIIFIFLKCSVSEYEFMINKILEVWVVWNWSFRWGFCRYYSFSYVLLILGYIRNFLKWVTGKIELYTRGCWNKNVQLCHWTLGRSQWDIFKIDYSPSPFTQFIKNNLFWFKVFWENIRTNHQGAPSWNFLFIKKIQNSFLKKVSSNFR